MTGRIVCFIIAVCAMTAFAPAAVADCGGDHGSKKGWFQKFWGEDDDHRHGKCGKCKKKKCHYAKRGGKGISHPFWWRSSAMAEVLRLDEGQVSQLDAIEKSHRGKIMDAYHKVAGAKMAYKKVKMSGSSTAGEIRSAWRAKMDAKREKKSAKLEMLLEMREVLTPDQREELMMIKAHKKRGKKKR